MSINFKQYLKHKPLLDSNGYLILFLVFMCVVISFAMMFLYSGNEEQIYSVTGTLNILISFGLPASTSIAGLYFLIYYFNKNNFVSGIAFISLIFSSKLSFMVISGLSNDLYHIYTSEYKVITGEPSTKPIGHGFELTIDNLSFDIQLHRAHPAFASPQLDRIRENEYLEVKYYGNQILEINIKDNKSVKLTKKRRD